MDILVLPIKGINNPNKNQTTSHYPLIPIHPFTVNLKDDAESGEKSIL